MIHGFRSGIDRVARFLLGLYVGVCVIQKNKQQDVVQETTWHEHVHLC